MHMRIVWGRIAPGQWDSFEAAYKKATSLRGNVKGLKNQWLARDQGDPDAGYSITLWDSEVTCVLFGTARSAKRQWPYCDLSSLNQFTVTACEVRLSQNE